MIKLGQIGSGALVLRDCSAEYMLLNEVTEAYAVEFSRFSK